MADDADAHLTEAATTAARSGEGQFVGMFFGPTNVGFWRTAIAVELGDGGRVREIGRDLAPEQIDSQARQAAYFMDFARGLAQARRNDREAIAHFIHAETLAPQRVRLSPAVRDSVGAMLRRARANAGGADLRAFASRVGAA
jgi:hypothetical protein